MMEEETTDEAEHGFFKSDGWEDLADIVEEQKGDGEEENEGAPASSGENSSTGDQEFDQ
ncbi:unnamed protein product, partial [Rotaria sp. Silwood1]